MGSQSESFVGVDEVPPFVCDRIELAFDMAIDPSRNGFGPGESDRGAPEALGSRNSNCMRTTTPD